MNGQTQTLFYALVMILAGIGIPTMAALNAGLGQKLQNPYLATSILFVVALLASSLFLFVLGGKLTLKSAEGVPFYFYLGGLFVLFYVLSVTWIAPSFGIGNAVAFVLLGQLISITVIDHFSLLGAVHFPLSPARAIGLLFMAVGVFLVVKRY